MSEIDMISFLLLILVVLQSVAGVGVLVVGTPSLLMLHYSLPDALSLLLPISILTSLLNLFVFKFYKDNEKFSINSKIKKYFFIICLPSIFIGLFFLKLFNEIINLKIIVSLVILLSLYIKLKFNFLFKAFSNLTIKYFLLIVGMIHGFTNSGGTLLSLFLSSLITKKNQTRYNITFFYFFLALFQYILFLLLFNLILDFERLLINLIICMIGVITGNFLVKKFSEKYFQILIQTLAFVASLILLIDSFFAF
tara:strand:+ start:1126 stop:1881 length:756 start_codon:yes stop_codon:yes gene_type:complete